LANDGTEAYCSALAQARYEEEMKECECNENEKSRAAYEENRKECDTLEGADKEACEKKWKEVR